MKFVTVLAFLGCLSAALAACCYERECLYTEGHNGRFTCAAGDVGKKFRNNNDPTKYWTCTAADQPAECASCPVEFLFTVKDADGKEVNDCVCFADWIWSPPCDPERMITDASGCEACTVPGSGSGSGSGAGCGGSGAGAGCGSGSGSGSGSAGCGCKSS